MGPSVEATMELSGTRTVPICMQLDKAPQGGPAVAIPVKNRGALTPPWIIVQRMIPDIRFQAGAFSSGYALVPMVICRLHP